MRKVHLPRQHYRLVTGVYIQQENGNLLEGYILECQSVRAEQHPSGRLQRAIQQVHEKSYLYELGNELRYFERNCAALHRWTDERTDCLNEKELLSFGIWTLILWRKWRRSTEICVRFRWRAKAHIQLTQRIQEKDNQKKRSVLWNAREGQIEINGF